MNRELLEKPFANNLIRSRKGSFGQSFSYVEGSAYIARLNEALDGNWSFEVVEHHVRDSEVVVLGKLTCDGVTKMAFGGSSITVSREGEVISIADDLKAACTDAIKKAASLLGVGLHLYSSDRPAETASTRTTKPSNGNGRPHQGNGNGSGNGNGQRQSANGTSNGNRLTARQQAALFSMARSLGKSADAIREETSRRYGCPPEQLSKGQASEMIQELGEALSGPAASAA
jgi:hypothetical protein